MAAGLTPARMNLLAWCVTITACLMLAAFHFLPAFESPLGWMAWQEVIAILKEPSHWADEPLSGLICFSFISLCLWLPATPLLIFAARRYRLIWWLMALFSGSLAIGLCVPLLAFNPVESGPWHVGGWALFFSAPVNLLGVMMIRQVPPDDPVGSGAPDGGFA